MLQSPPPAPPYYPAYPAEDRAALEAAYLKALDDYSRAGLRQLWTIAAIMLIPPFSVLGLLAWLT
jgi:hypothetical protein